MVKQIIALLVPWIAQVCGLIYSHSGTDHLGSGVVLPSRLIATREFQARNEARHDVGLKCALAAKVSALPIVLPIGRMATFKVDSVFRISGFKALDRGLILEFSDSGGFIGTSRDTLRIFGFFNDIKRQIFYGDLVVLLDSSQVDFVRPEYWGARADGKTDNTIAIQKSINSGKNVRFGDGIYVIKMTSSVSRDRNYALSSNSQRNQQITISGLGIGRSVIKLVRTGSESLSAIALSYTTLTNLSIDGGFDRRSMSANLSQVVALGTRAILDRVHVFHAMGSCVIAGSGHDIEITDCIFDTFGDHAIYFSGSKGQNVVKRVRVYDNIVTDSASYHNNKLYPPPRGAIKLRDNVSDVFIKDNIVHGDIGILISGGADDPSSVPRGVNLVSNQIRASYDGLQIWTTINSPDRGNRIRDITVSGENRFSLWGAQTIACIELKHAGADIENNVFDVSINKAVDGSASQTEASFVKLNRLIGDTSGGFGLYALGAGSIISDNYLYCVPQGIYVTAYNSIIRNMFEKCGRAIRLAASPSLGEDATEVAYNLFKYNILAVQMDAASRGIVFHDNTFVGNKAALWVHAGANNYNSSIVYNNVVVTGAAFPKQDAEGRPLKQNGDR